MLQQLYQNEKTIRDSLYFTITLLNINVLQVYVINVKKWATFVREVETVANLTEIPVQGHIEEDATKENPLTIAIQTPRQVSNGICCPVQTDIKGCLV